MADDASILVVEDEPASQELLAAVLCECGFGVKTIGDGLEAWSELESHPDRYAVVLLDRGLPGMGGMEVLARMRQHATLRHVPVVMETANDSAAAIAEGVRAGAYYYLAKPLAPASLAAVVRAAVGHFHRHQELREDARRPGRTMQWIRHAEFAFESPAQASDLASLAAAASPQADRVVVGLCELLINAVEHGNLGLTYEEKSRLLATGQLAAEVARRLAERPRRAHLFVDRQEGRVQYRIVDQGAGFDWRAYLDIDPSRAFESHGRGIAVARMLSFDEIEYRGTGNEVVGTIWDRPRTDAA